MFMGISFLVEWLWRGWFRLPRQDYAVVLLIVGMTGLFGYLAGVATGIGAAMSIFVAACSKINVIKQAMTGAEYHSNVDRDPRSREILNERGRAVLVLKLDGFLFFGTVHGLVTHIQADATRRTHLVIDFKDVVGMDSSAVKGLAKLYDHCRQRDCVLLLSGLSPQLKRDVANAGFDAVEAAGVHFFDDADQAMEACEDEILALATAGTKIAPIRWRDQLQSALSSQEKIGTFMAYLDMRDYEGGEILIRQGEQARDMFFIESGRITARLELGAGKAMRLRTMGGGTTVGEIGCYLGQTRTASIVADVPTRAYRLSAEALRQMEERDPDLAAALHRYMVALLADRLSATASLLRKVLS
jgi:SulP family sulfate permease